MVDMRPSALPPTPADRRLYGDLVDDVYLLRSRGRLVARFKGQFRVDAEVVDAAGIRQMAADLRARMEAEASRPPRTRRSAVAWICKKCGGPRAKGSGSFCRPCYVEAGNWPTQPASAAPVAESATLAPKPVARPISRAPAAAQARPAIPQPGVRAPFHSTDLGAKPRIVWLDLGLLVVDKTYQREIGDRGGAHVNRIVAAFNWNCYQPIVVSERNDGRYAVIDGQHRLEAARRHPLINELPCYIIDAPDVAAQARIFVSLNTDRLSLTSQHKFWAAHAAGEPTAIALVKICEQAGVKVLRSPPSGTAPPLSLLAPMVGQTMIRVYGEAPVSEAISLLAKSQPNTAMAFRAHFIVALTRIAAGRGYARDRALAVMTKVDLQQIHIEAMNAAPAAGGGGRASATESVFRARLGMTQER